MKKSSKILWGLLLIAVGAIFALNAAGIADIDVFFDGWWTLFIIIPCGIGIFNEQDKMGNLIGLLIGVFLLLCCQDVLSFGMLWKMIVPAIIILVGIKLLFGGLFGNKANEMLKDMKASGNNPKSGNAMFSGQNMNFDGEVFEGAELNAVFGGIKCDLRKAIIEKDCAINVSAIFGGIDILVPENVNVKVNTTAVFGGVSDKRKNNNANSVTIYISGTCLFGGVDIK